MQLNTLSFKSTEIAGLTQVKDSLFGSIPRVTKCKQAVNRKLAARKVFPISTSLYAVNNPTVISLK
jgi:hypothetical protein